MHCWEIEKIEDDRSKYHGVGTGLVGTDFQIISVHITSGQVSLIVREGDVGIGRSLGLLRKRSTSGLGTVLRYSRAS